MNGKKNIHSTTQGGMRALRRGCFGFTLIETVVAFLVLTIGLLAMVSLAVSVIQGNKASGQISTATALAQDKMEELRGVGYNGLPSSDSPPVKEDYGAIPDFSHYKRVAETLVEIYDASGNVTTDPNAPVLTIVKTVTVTVYWDSDQHEVRSHMRFSR